MTIAHERALLENQIQSAAHGSLFIEMKSGFAAMASVDSWATLLKDLGSRDMDDSRSDALMRVLMVAYAAQSDRRLVDVMTIAVWSRLVAIFVRTRRYDADPSELWQNIQFYFLQTIQHPGLSNRDAIMRRIYFGVLRRVYRHYQKSWRVRLQTSKTCKLDSLVPCRDDSSSVVELRDEQDVHRNTLAKAKLRGVIDDVDRQLIITTRIDGLSLPMVAKRLGITIGAAKGRRVRAEQRLASAGFYVPIALWSGRR